MTKTSSCGMMMSTKKGTKLNQERQWECDGESVNLLNFPGAKVYVCTLPHMREVEELEAAFGCKAKRTKLNTVKPGETTSSRKWKRE